MSNRFANYSMTLMRPTRVGLALAICALIGLATSPMIAATSLGPPNGSTFQHAEPMTVNCATLTTGQLHDAEAHGVCGNLGPDGRVTPYNAASGNCGQTYIWGYPQGGGEIDFSIGGNSTIGPVRNFYTNLNWHNWSTDVSGNRGYTGPPNTATSWWHDFFEFTDAGWVTVSQTGDAQLMNGTICNFIPTSDGETVT